ncbi:MAG TPA: glycosyltransferase family A protein [Steroidobacteraceae bacterium]|nr:glycosyltransferase family A protein [Steroidobacteraceae bacterium]
MRGSGPATITCIVSVHHGARFLAEALDSVFAQTLQPTEIILIDDGSTDDTAMVAAEHASCISYIRQVNAAPAAARNIGLALATGDFISFLDADDVWAPDKLERQVRVLETNPATGMCITHLQDAWVEELGEERARLGNADLASLVPGLVQCLVARRGVFELVGRFDATKRLAADDDWLSRAERAGVIRETVSLPLVRRRIHVHSVTYQMYRRGKDRRVIPMDRTRRLNLTRG